MCGFRVNYITMQKQSVKIHFFLFHRKITLLIYVARHSWMIAQKVDSKFFMFKQNNDII